MEVIMKCKSSLLTLVFVLLLCAACSTAKPTEPAYTVDITASDFVDLVDNPYFPLIPGSRYVYAGMTKDGLERVEIEVLSETREVLGVKTTIMRDTVYLEGEMVEDTFDWFAQDKDGNVWYLGEDVSNYKDGELEDKDGSWEAGVDSALPGIVMYADPAAHVGETYRQEYYAGEAEDMAEVVSLGQAVSTASGDYENCLKTKEWTPLESGFSENKYYAPGIGMVLEVISEGGEGQMELVDMLNKK
jgi:hypothetical protein